MKTEPSDVSPDDFRKTGVRHSPESNRRNDLLRNVLTSARIFLVFLATSACGDNAPSRNDAGPDAGKYPFVFEPATPLSNCTIEWANIYEDLPGVTNARGTAVVELLSGGYAIFGEAGPEDPLDSWDSSDGMLMLLDEDGNQTDFESFPAENAGHFTRAHVTEEGVLAIGSQGGLMWLSMFQDDGTELFSYVKDEGGPATDSYYVYDNEIYTVWGNNDSYLGTLNTDGDYFNTMIADSPVNAYGIAPSPNSKIAVVGWLWSDVPANHFDDDYWESFFMLCDPSTTTEANYQVVFPGLDSQLLRIVPGHSGGFAAGGGIAIEEDPWPKTILVKLDALGSVEWSRYYGLNYSTGMHRLLSLDIGFVYVATMYKVQGSGNGYIVRLDDNGRLLWHSSPFTETGSIVDVIESSDGNYLAIGYANTTTGQWPCAVKIRSEGECI